MDKNFYIKLKSESEYKECIRWFQANLTDDVFTSLQFLEYSWDTFHWEESQKHWCLTQRSTNSKEYSWEGFLKEVVAGFTGTSTDDIFTIGKNVRDLPIRSVRIPRYYDGQGMFNQTDYNLANCSSTTTIINVTEDYFQLSGFSNGWFKKSDIIQKSVPQWYLQYTSEITKELFDKLVDKLDPKKFRRHCNFTMTYENFKESCYIRTGINGDGDSSEWEGKWSIDNNPQSILTSKTLWDLLDKETETKFKVGNWYESYEKDKFFFKFKELNGSGYLHCSEHINLRDSEYINRGGGVGRTTDYKAAIEVSSEALSKYLPDGHPDKWITVSLTALNFGETKTMFSGSSIKPLPVFVEPEKPKTKDKEEKPLSLISSKKLKIDFVI